MTDYISREAVNALIEAECSPKVAAFLNHAIDTIPAADVRPVVVCAKCEHNNHCLTQEFVEDCGKIPLDRNTFFCADGERADDV